MTVLLGPRIVRPQVLALDEEPMARLMYERVLRQQAEVMTAASSGEAVAMLERRVVDVVVMAQRMPDVLGSELARFLRARWPRVRVVVVCDRGDDPWLGAAVRGGLVDRVVVVPFRRHELQEAVLDVMWRPRASA